MRYRITVEERRLSVEDVSRQRRLAPIDLGDNHLLPWTLAQLLNAGADRAGGVRLRDLRGMRGDAEPVEHASFTTRLRRHEELLRAAFPLGSQPWLRIERAGAPRSRRVQLLISPEAELVLSETFAKLWAAPTPADASVGSRFKHRLAELMSFAEALQKAAMEFESGQVTASSQTLLNALKGAKDPRHTAALRMRLVRSLLGLGKEDEARIQIRDALAEIRKLQPVDHVLRARALYNAAWLAYTRGDFGEGKIRIARSALDDAAPDDIRHGFLLSLQGLQLLKSITGRGIRDADRARDAETLVSSLAHAIYLLARSEEFWGLQQACWALARAFFVMGCSPHPAIFNVATGSLDYSVRVSEWLTLSDNINWDHFRVRDVARNQVLWANLRMKSKQIGEADAHLARAERVAENLTPREQGRLLERRVAFHLLQVELGDRRAEQAARAAYDRAVGIWDAAGLHKLIERELRGVYVVKGSSICRKH